MSVCLKEIHTKYRYAKNAWAKSKVTRTHMPVNKEEFFVHFITPAVKSSGIVNSAMRCLCANSRESGFYP